MKAIPSLADRFLATRWAPHEQFVQPKVVDALKKKVRDAHRFVFGNDAASRVGSVVDAIPDLLVREADFAMAPYELTWIEYDHRAYWLATVTAEARVLDIHNNGTQDHTVGYLVDHNTVTVIFGGTLANPLRRPEIYPVQYHLNTEFPEVERRAFLKAANISSDRMFDECVWGTSCPRIDAATLAGLRNRNSLSFLPVTPGGQRAIEKKRDLPLLAGATGELRTIIAFLLMMNRPHITRFTNTPGGRHFHKGKIIPYLTHSVVDVDLDAVATVRLMKAPRGESGIKLRRHETKGHFRHDQTAHDMMRICGCIHEWLPAQLGKGKDHRKWTIDTDIPLGTRRRWLCHVCGGKRWRVDDFSSGTAEKGFVVKDGYQIGASSIEEMEEEEYERTS